MSGVCRAAGEVRRPHPVRGLLSLVLALALAVLFTPDAGVSPTVLSLTRVETAKYVDFEDGVLWILVLGSDARPGEEVTEGRSDAIHLVGLDLQAGRAAGIGIPRDAWVEIPGDGRDRINTAMQVGDGDDGPQRGAELAAEVSGTSWASPRTTCSWRASKASGP